MCDKFLENKCTFKNENYFHNETGQRIAAIIPVFALGNTICPLKLKQFKRKFRIPLIIDAAAAIGAKGNSFEIGEFDYDFATLSFNGNKIITCGSGGAILCKNSENYEKLRHLAATARMHPSYFHDEIGYNYRISNIGAALGLAQLEQIDELLKKKDDIFNFYKTKLQSDNIVFYNEPKNLISSKWISGFMLENSTDKEIVEFLKYMGEKRIGASSFWAPVSHQKAFSNSLNLLNANSEKISKKFIALPSSINLTQKDLMYVVNEIKYFFKEFK